LSVKLNEKKYAEPSIDCESHCSGSSCFDHNSPGDIAKKLIEAPEDAESLGY